MSLTSRLSWPYPIGSDAADVPNWMLQQATFLDANLAVDGQGTLAARPAAGMRGRFYTTTDEMGGPITYRDQGSVWVRVQTMPKWAVKLFMSSTSFNINHNFDASGWSTAALISAWTERYDTRPTGMHDTVTNPERITFRDAGKFAVWGNAPRGPSTSINASPERSAVYLAGLRGGAAFTRRFEFVVPASLPVTAMAQQFYFEDEFAVNDYLAMYVIIASAGSGNVPFYGASSAGAWATEFGAHLIQTN